MYALIECTHNRIIASWIICVLEWTVNSMKVWVNYVIDTRHKFHMERVMDSCNSWFYETVYSNQTVLAPYIPFAMNPAPILTHLPLVPYIYIYIYIYIYASVNWVSIGSDNGLSPLRCKDSIWTNAGLLLIWPLGTIINEILIKMQNFSFTKMYLKMSSAKGGHFVSASMC